MGSAYVSHGRVLKGTRLIGEQINRPPTRNPQNFFYAVGVNV